MMKVKLIGPKFMEISSSSSSASYSAAVFVAKRSFHSTTVLEKKRKTQWHSRFNYYAKKKKIKEPKRTAFRNFNDYAEFLFQSWREETERNHASEPSWFRNHHWVRNETNNRNNFNNNNNNGFNPFNSRSNYKNNGFDSSDDDEESETFFRSDFGRERFSNWSFENSNFRNNTSRNSYYYFRNSNKWTYDDSDSDSENEDFGTSGTEFGSKNEVYLARETLGLNVSGPLKLEEVKNAYRMSALRWHPDRHNGSSKVEAEEKFKHCGAAYKTLCDSLNDKV